MSPCPAYEPWLADLDALYPDDGPLSPPPTEPSPDRCTECWASDDDSLHIVRGTGGLRFLCGACLEEAGGLL